MFEILHLFPGQGPEAPKCHFHRIKCYVHKAARCADERQSNDQFFAYAIRRNQKRRMAGGTVAKFIGEEDSLRSFIAHYMPPPSPSNTPRQ